RTARQQAAAAKRRAEGREDRDDDLLIAAGLAYAEASQARTLFPGPDAMLYALTEEVGELARALLSEPAERVRKEALQVAAVALRIACEGDASADSLRGARRLGISKVVESRAAAPHGIGGERGGAGEGV